MKATTVVVQRLWIRDIVFLLVGWLPDKDAKGRFRVRLEEDVWMPTADELGKY
jgi:hypothetical protein